MSEEWKEITLDQIYEFKSGLSKPRAEFGFGSGFVSFKDVFYNFFIPDELTELVNSSESEQVKCSVKRGDVFLTRTSETFNELGMSSVALKNYERATFNGFTKRLRPLSEDTIYPEYAGYYFRSKYFRKLMNSFSTMSTRASLNNEILSKLSIRFPSFERQIAIANQLRSLDQKIHLLRQQNATLEAMAQALFKSWFVDFDPVIDNALAAGRALPEALAVRVAKRRAVLESGEYPKLPEEVRGLFPGGFVFSEALGRWVPEGWEVKALGDFISIKRGGSPRPIKDFMVPDGLPWVKIADATKEPSPFLFKTSGFIKKEGLSKTVYLNKGSLILSNSATPGLPMFLNLDACIHDGWLYFPQISHFTDKYLYFQFLKLREEFVSRGNGSVFTNLKTDIIRQFHVVVPSKTLIEIFSLQAGQMLNNIKDNAEQIRTLTRLRDVLLPELISGRVKV